MTDPTPAPDSEMSDTASTGETDATADAHQGDGPNHMVPISRLTKESEKRRAVEGELTVARDLILSNVPEKLRGLAPKSGPIGDLKDWISAAKEAGLFDGPAPAPVPSTDSPRPASMGSAFDNLPASALLEAGYKRSK